MKRVAYVVFQYPQMSETYASTEMRYIAPDYDLDIISVRPPDTPGIAEQPYVVLGRERQVLERIRKFAPDVIHTHWLGDDLGLVCRVARKLDIPFTVRAHSFDTLWGKPRSRWYRTPASIKDRSKPIARNLKTLNSDLCLGILAFPFSVERLAGAGISTAKITPCWPVIDYERFHDETDNKPGRVMNGGAALPKKNFGAYLSLAQLVPDRHFDLYPIGYEAPEIRKVNESLGRPVAIHDALQHAQMPGVYKDHEWLVYTADTKDKTVGWPVMVAEAQAAGTGVCFPNLRPDVHEYVGTAGFVYNSLDEVAEIISRPFPQSMRKAGFEHARRSDVRSHLHLLTFLWQNI